MIEPQPVELLDEPPLPRRHDKKPPWLKVRLKLGPNYRDMKRLMRDLSLHTVCEEALCPNIFECWEERTGTFMVLGNVCTRRCAFCAVTSGRPGGAVDHDEPHRVAHAAQYLGLKHVVITSVARDDLPDGGASAFAECIRRCREYIPDCAVEVLIPDFRGSESALRAVMDARPDVLNHNVETVPRLYRVVRPSAKYYRSLELLYRAKQMDPSVPTKAGIMVGLGEEWDEVIDTVRDIRRAEVDIITVGQYLRPTYGERHLPVARYYTPEEFAVLKDEALAMGFGAAECGPLVRSSYHAQRAASAVRER
ncbi:MAG: lipoyl synthase [Chloroflexi bacterium]|nr:lipoyl synthase [Chloroflexota bacterium]